MYTGVNKAYTPIFKGATGYFRWKLCMTKWDNRHAVECNCRRYGFAILRNYDGHDFKVTLVDSNGDRVAGGYSVAVSTSIFNAGTYYWEVENKTTTGSTYGGITYEVRSGG